MYAGSSKAIEQVLTGSPDKPAIVATTALESTPPDRKAPSGTSEIMRSRTDSSSFAVNFEQASSRPMLVSSAKAHVPVWPRLAQGLAAPHRQRVRRRQLAGLVEDAARLGHVAEREVLLDCERVDLAIHRAVREQALELRAENQRPVVEQRIVQRLHAQPVTRQEQRGAIAVPQREGEHAAEALDAGLAPRLPGMHDHLGVAAWCGSCGRAPAARE